MLLYFLLFCPHLSCFVPKTTQISRSFPYLYNQVRLFDSQLTNLWHTHVIRFVFKDIEISIFIHVVIANMRFTCMYISFELIS